MLISQKAFACGIIFLVLFATAVFAIPGVPHQFYGGVTINGNTAPDGTTVSARISGAEVKSTTTAGGKYGYNPNIFYVDDPNNNRAGKTINFFVNNVDTGSTAIFSSGASTQVNLAITVSVPSTPSNPSGGEGGGALPSPPQNKTTATNQTAPQSTTSGSCTEKWLCSDWSACGNDNLQIRACEDENKCGTDNSKPFESQPCTTVITDTENQSSTTPQFSIPPITAFIAANPAIAGGIIVVILIIIYLVWRMTKKKKATPNITQKATPKSKPSTTPKTKYKGFRKK